MHHFSKQINKKLWYHITLSVGSALVTVALFDTLCSLSWLCKDYDVIVHYTSEDDKDDKFSPINMMDIIYWIFVSYRMVLSIVICVGGIFMGRRIIVITWLLVSLCIDLVHLSETIYILSRPNLVQTWPVVVAVVSCIWQELKIIRIKYRIIRRSLLVDTNNNNSDEQEYEPETLKKELNRHCDSKGNFHFRVMDNEDSDNSNDFGSLSLVCIPFASMYCKADTDNCSENSRKVKDNSSRDRMSDYIATNAIHFIKLLRNLYNLLTWHFTGYLFGGDHLHLISSNNTATLLEKSFVRYARLFLDALTVIWIIQEKKLLLTPWIMAYIMIASASIAIFLFTLLYFDHLTTLFGLIYYLVFSVDLFFRCSFLVLCIRYVVRTKKLV